LKAANCAAIPIKPDETESIKRILTATAYASSIFQISKSYVFRSFQLIVDQLNSLPSNSLKMMLMADLSALSSFTWLASSSDMPNVL